MQFKIIFGYISSSRQACDTWDPISKEEKEKNKTRKRRMKRRREEKKGGSWSPGEEENDRKRRMERKKHLDKTLLSVQLLWENKNKLGIPPVWACWHCRFKASTPLPQKFSTSLLIGSCKLKIKYIAYACLSDRQKSRKEYWQDHEDPKPPEPLSINCREQINSEYTLTRLPTNY